MDDPAKHPASTPMSEADRILLQRAAELRRPLARAAKLGRWNGAGYAVFGALSLALALPDWDAIGLALGAVLVAVGLFEREQSKRLLAGDDAAPRRLSLAELTLLGAIMLYGVLGLTVLPAADATLHRQLHGGNALGLDIEKFAASVSRTWYVAVILVAVLYQGGMARYFRKRQGDLTRYKAAAPDWARRVLDSMAD